MMKTGFLNIIIILLSNWTLAASGKTEEKPASWYWQQGLEAAHRNAADTALSFLKQSYGRGISDDSLYYLWAEVFLYKGVLDTALALNFSVKPSCGELHKKALEQRYLIYSSLGWQNEANALRDSLPRKPGMNPRRLIPECNLSLSGGGYREKNAGDRSYPFARASDSTATIIDGNGDALLRFGWSIPIGKSQGVQFGARLRYSGSRFSIASLKERINDSTDVSAGGYFRYKLFSGKLALYYACNRRMDFLDRTSFLHQFSLQYAVSPEKWMGFFEAGYQYRFPFLRHYYYVSTFFDRPIDRKSDIGLALQFSGMSVDEQPIKTYQPFIYVKDTRAYRDSISSEPIDSLKNRIKKGILDTISDLLPIYQSIGQSFMAIHPSLQYEYFFTKKFSTGVKGGYSLIWYRKKYEWVDFRYQTPPHLNFDPFYRVLAYDKNNGNYYWINNLGYPLTADNPVYLDPLPVTFHSERRVDQTLSLNLFFNCSLGRFGDMILDITGERNFSTLMRAAPVDIPKWYGEVMLTWFFRFKLDYGPGRR